MSELKSGAVELEDVQEKLARDFHGVYSTLVGLMAIEERKAEAKRMKEEKQQKSRSSSTPSSSAAGISLKRPPTSPRVGTAKRKKAAKPLIPESEPNTESEPTTPDQPTHPRDPDYTGDTVASKNEGNTRQLLERMVYYSLSMLGRDFSRITWQESGNKVLLYERCLSFYIRLINSAFTRL